MPQVPPQTIRLVTYLQLTWNLPGLFQSENKDRIYLFAQVAHPVAAFAAIASQNLLTIPMWVAGGFRFGFPQLTSALILPFVNKSFFKDNLERAMSVTNGLALCVHHFAATGLYAMVCLHLESLSSMAVFGVPLALQHITIVLKYWQPTL